MVSSSGPHLIVGAIGRVRRVESTVGGHRVGQLCFLKGNTRAARKRPDEFVVRLLKQRIRKALGITVAAREPAVVETA